MAAALRAWFSYIFVLCLQFQSDFHQVGLKLLPPLLKISTQDIGATHKPTPTHTSIKVSVSDINVEAEVLKKSLCVKGDNKFYRKTEFCENSLCCRCGCTLLSYLSLLYILVIHVSQHKVYPSYPIPEEHSV